GKSDFYACTQIPPWVRRSARSRRAKRMPRMATFLPPFHAAGTETLVIEADPKGRLTWEDLKAVFAQHPLAPLGIRIRYSDLAALRSAVIRLFPQSRMREAPTYGSVVGPTWQRLVLPIAPSSNR